MLAIKLKRAGKKHQPSYRLVVDEKRSKILGQNIEDLGWYNPHTKKHDFKGERVSHWLKVGAQPTDTVHNLLISAGLLEGSKIPVHKVSKKKVEESEGGEAAASTAEASAPAPAEEAKPAEEAPKAEEEKKEEAK